MRVPKKRQVFVALVGISLLSLVFLGFGCGGGGGGGGGGGVEPAEEELIRQMYQKLGEYCANEDLSGIGSLIHDDFLRGGETKADLLADLEELFAEADDIQWDFDVREIMVAGNDATVKQNHTLSFLPIGEVKRISKTDVSIDFLRKGSDWKLYGNQEEFYARLHTSFWGVSGEYQLGFAAELDPTKFPNVTSVVVNGPAVDPGGLALMQFDPVNRPEVWVGSVDLVGTPIIGEEYTFTVTYVGGVLQRVTEITGYFDAVPILISPAEGATTSPTPTFVWEDSVPNRVVYEVAVRDVWEGHLDGTSAVYNFNNQGPDLLPGTYYWSVSALDWNSNSAISDERSFIVP